jgi:S1-C subfamily serine protease
MVFANGSQELPEGMVGPGTGTAGVGAPGTALGPGARAFAPEAELVEDEGLLITAVLEDSAAHSAGLQRGDVILSVNGTDVSTPYELRSELAELRAGTDVDMELRSGSDTDTVTVTLEDRYNMPPLGVRVQAEPGSFAAAAGGLRGAGAGMWPGQTGMWSGRPGTSAAYLILEVVDDSPADDAGLDAGDIVTGIEGELAPGETITVSYMDDERESETTSLTVGDEEGRAYIGVRYRPTGGAMPGLMTGPQGAVGPAGTAGPAGPAGPAAQQFRGRTGGPRSGGPRGGNWGGR